ncbi:hypothetical protein O0I10_012946 [Lichtheimia ornata]|uniref:Integrase catalytic domain-containing protein n=1 Tax=Lichtheimia ornata TaxID=688661 RepID=A0AAD7UQY2_9FUNG|nr:uncharacterized protein O0I10_012946 [Lichtheimia ornata]KAJ8651493.1 hypothetical protein O0I10_012946 [Lichtheimia ornata]
MHTLLDDLPFVATFVDDVVIFSKSMAEHREHVINVIQRLTDVNLILNADKCHFAQKSIYLLGFCIDANGRRPDPRKLVNVDEWPIPKTGKDIQRFLGLINFFRSHLPLAAELTAPLDALRNHGSLAKVWQDVHLDAFNNVKAALLAAPVLSHPDITRPFFVATDASNHGIGAVLYQIDPDTQARQYVSFVARALTKSERNYFTTKRELLAIVFTLKKFHQFLWGKKFTLYTDHKALIYLHTQPHASPMIVGWLDVICNYDFDIVHLPGIQNVLPDRLSRLFAPQETSLTLEGGNSQFKSPFAHSISHAATKLMHRLFKPMEMITPPEEERTKLPEQSHLNGHFGADAIVNDLHDNGIFWTNMKDDALKHVGSCLPYQRYNIGKHGYYPLRSINADGPGDHWAIDLCELHCTTPSGNNYILVMVDVFTHFCVLRPIRFKSAIDIVKELSSVFSLFGYPKIIQSDNGSEFKNNFVHLLSKHTGMDHRLVTPYHPRANGLAERMVETVKTALFKRLEGRPETWDLYLDSTMYAINTKHHSDLKTRPFALMFARQPNAMRDYSQAKSANPAEVRKSIMKRIKEMEDIVIPGIHEGRKARNEVTKTRYNKTHRMHKDIPIGSQVMIVNINRSSKTDPIYDGPYIVHFRTPKGNYVLRDKMGKLLQRNIPPHQVKRVSDDPKADGDTFYEFEAIVDHRLHAQHGYPEYRVHSRGYSDEDDTWEPAENFSDISAINAYIKRRFPNGIPSDDPFYAAAPNNDGARATKRRRTGTSSRT